VFSIEEKSASTNYRFSIGSFLLAPQTPNQQDVGKARATASLSAIQKLEVRSRKIQSDPTDRRCPGVNLHVHKNVLPTLDTVGGSYVYVHQLPRGMAYARLKITFRWSTSLSILRRLASSPSFRTIPSTS